MIKLRHVEKLIVIIVIITLGLYTTHIWFQTGPAGFNTWPPIYFERWFDGTLMKPFSGRVLPAILTDLILEVIPQSLIDLFKDQLFDLCNYFKIDFNLYGNRLGAYVFITFLSYSGGFLALLYIVNKEISQDPAIKILFIPFIVMLMPQFFASGGRFLYDPLQFFLTCICITLICYNKLHIFYMVFPFAVLNKETSVFFIIIMLLNLKSNINRLKHFTIACSIYACFRIIVYMAHDSDANYWIEDHYLANMNKIFNGAFLNNISEIAAIGLLFLLTIFDWSNKSNFLRSSSIIFWPILFAYIYGGFWGEYRIFIEVFPIVVLLAYQGVLFLTTAQRDFATYRCSTKTVILSFSILTFMSIVIIHSWYKLFL